MKDEELICLVQTSPENGMRLLMETYMKQVYGIVSHRLGSAFSEEDVEDCVADVFTSFYEHIDQYHLEQGKLSGYLSAIAQNKANMLLRRYYRIGQTASLDDEKTFMSIAGSERTEESVLEQERTALLMDAVGQLDQVDHEIIMGKYYYGESAKTLAKRLSMTVMAVNTRASRILKRLRRTLEAQGYHLQDFGL